MVNQAVFERDEVHPIRFGAEDHFFSESALDYKGGGHVDLKIMLFPGVLA
jgi:hypothetical protein